MSMLKHTAIPVALALCCSCTAPTEPVLTRVMSIHVASAMVPCVSTVRTSCLQTRTSTTEAWEPFYGDIEGFRFEPGFEYALEVAVYRLPRTVNGTAERYELRRIVTRVEEPAA
jgi:hypothetical protein